MQVGIDVGGTKILLIAKKQAEINYRCQLSTGINFSIADAEATISSFIQKLPEPPSSIGIAIPGLVDRDGQVVACDVLPKICGWNPSSKFDRICPVRVFNDAEAALFEAIHGLEANATAAVIMIGTGIGAAFYVNGQVLRGASGWAGELGSIPISLGHGKDIQTLDRLASGAAIVQKLRVDGEQLSALVDRGDNHTLEAIREAGYFLGLGIATVINIFNPSLIVLAGGTLRWSGYFEAALQSAQANSLPELWENCRVQKSDRGEDLVALGAIRATLV